MECQRLVTPLKHLSKKGLYFKLQIALQIDITYDQ